MADTILKSKAQLRSISVTSNGSASSSGDKTPTTPSKLMINHGKPNFTIQRSPKAQQNGEDNPLTHELQANKNNNYNPYKKAETQSYKANNNIIISTKFNGAFKPVNVPITQKQPHQNGNDENDNEAAKVVLRRPKAAEPLPQDNDEDNEVPEFIKRQRRIQERLAKENILDFENRRSGYFTHVVITPTSPNRQSLVETMTSPAVVPALEMPPSTPTTPPPQVAMTTMLEERVEEVEPSKEHETVTAAASSHTTNGHHIHAEAEAEAAEEEEVAKAIEEVNKAVAGEDDEKLIEQPEQFEHIEENTHTEHVVPKHEASEPVVPVTSTWHPIEPPAEFQNHNHETAVEESVDMPAVVAAVSTMEITEPAPVERTTPPPNGHIEVVEVHAAPNENGQSSDVTILHTNGFDGPSIPAPDPSGALGVNYEPKTVVSFSKDLSSEPNKYPDTVKVTTENGGAKTPIDEELQDIAKLKFDIKADEQDVQVTPVLRAD